MQKVKFKPGKFTISWLSTVWHLQRCFNFKQNQNSYRNRWYFFDNVNSKDSIYNFFLNQQDEKKKLPKIEFDFRGDSDDYITKYLPLIHSFNDDKFDILTFKNSKFLFYHFNSYLHAENRPGQLIKYGIVSNDTFALNTLQNKN